MEQDLVKAASACDSPTTEIISDYCMEVYSIYAYFNILFQN